MPVGKEEEARAPAHTPPRPSMAETQHAAAHQTPLKAKDPNAMRVKPEVLPPRFTAPLASTEDVDLAGASTPRARPIIVSVEAAIGTGKSSLLRLLERTLGAEGRLLVVQEPVEEWQKVGGKHNLLEAYYSNQERYAFSFQANCVLSRIRKLQEVLKTAPQETDVIVLERCWASDRNTFGEMLRRHDKISPLEWALYEEWYDFAVENAPFIDGHVYLEAKTETCMARLRRRDRAEEVGVTEEYQRDLIECHETWLHGLDDQHRVCRVSVDKEFIADPTNADAVVTQITDFVSALRSMRPGNSNKA